MTAEAIVAQTSDKEFNEMLSSLQKGRKAKANTRELRAPKPLQTHSSKCNSWGAVAVGFTLNESKQYIPTEKLNVPLFASKDEDSYVVEVANMLRSNSSIKGPDGVTVKLDVAESIEGVASVENKARHLCGGHNYKFDKKRAAFARFVPSTISGAALVAAMDTNRFYLRRYESGLHVVITTGEQILGQAFQGKADLVTQYHPEPIKQFALARVVYKNENLR